MLEIRKATEADIPLIQEIANATFPATYKDIITQEQIAFMMDWMYSTENLRQQMNEGHHFLLAYQGSQCMGYVSVQRENDTLFHLHKIYVSPQAQGLGVGKFLFNKVVEYIHSQCNTSCRMELNVNRYNRALAFYEHMGMHRDREGDFDIGNGYFMNDYIMAIDL